MIRNTTFVVAFLLASAPAGAHDLKAEVKAEADPIRVEAYFDDETPAQSARVTVTRSDGESIASGTTDDRGLWSFPKPSPGRYRITVESAGHRDDVRLTIPGAEEPTSAPAVESDTRLNPNLGLGIGLALLLGGSLAFVVLRSRRRRAAGS